MATIITQINSNGSHRRCDARCYNAKGKKCTCICGGLNHAVGHNQAIKNSIDWLTKTALDYPGDHIHIANNLQFHLLDERESNKSTAIQST